MNTCSLRFPPWIWCWLTNSRTKIWNSAFWLVGQHQICRGTLKLISHVTSSVLCKNLNHCNFGNKQYTIVQLRKNCSFDWEKLLKFETEDREFAKHLRSIEQFIQTLQVRTIFGKKKCFFNFFLKVSHLNYYFSGTVCPSVCLSFCKNANSVNRHLEF